eukprot:s2719_g10.t1
MSDMESEAQVADMAAGSPKQKPCLGEDSLAQDGNRSEMPLPTTPPGEVPTGLVTDLKPPSSPSPTPVPPRNVSNVPRSFAADAERSESWAPSWLRGKRWDAVNTELIEVPLIMPLARRLQVAPVVVGLGFLILAVIFFLYGIGGQLVCTVFGVAYPAFESFKAIEEFSSLKDPQDNVNQTYLKATGMQFWLTYWIVLAAITSFECLFYYVVVWIPFYYPLKLGTLLFLSAAKSKGAERVYNWFVLPVLKRNRQTIDDTLQESSKRLRKSVSNVASSAVDAGFGVGKQGVEQIRRGMTMVGPGIETVRLYVGSELARGAAAGAQCGRGIGGRRACGWMKPGIRDLVQGLSVGPVAFRFSGVADFPAPSCEYSLMALLGDIDLAVAHSKGQLNFHPGPVHLNFCFRDRSRPCVLFEMTKQ